MTGVNGSHLCGNAGCCNPFNTVQEVRQVNSSWESCFRGSFETCRHVPACMTDNKWYTTAEPRTLFQKMISNHTSLPKPTMQCLLHENTRYITPNQSIGHLRKPYLYRPYMKSVIHRDGPASVPYWRRESWYPHIASIQSNIVVDLLKAYGIDPQTKMTQMLQKLSREVLESIVITILMMRLMKWTKRMTLMAMMGMRSRKWMRLVGMIRTDEGHQDGLLRDC